jgi:acetolactate synthase-1/2/3 large subunit
LSHFKRKSVSERPEASTHVAKDSAVHRIATPHAPRVVDAFVDLLVHLGATHAFGCTGGTVALLCEALARSSLQVVQCRHESGAAFAATEAYFANGKVAVVFTTSGPSIVNALNGLMAARSEGAKVILVSGSTPRAQRGRGAFQETSASTMPRSIFESGPLFDYAIDVIDASDLAGVSLALEEGVNRKGGFVAHVAIPSSVQGQPSEPNLTFADTHALPSPRSEDIRELAALLASESFAVWVGFGAREHWRLVRAFVEKTGTPVMSSPRGRGIVPEDHPLFLGVTGLSSPWDTAEKVRALAPRRVLVLGSRLGELTSLWDERLVPEGGLVQIDIDAEVPRAFPNRPRLVIQADIGEVLDALLAQWPASRTTKRFEARPPSAIAVPQFRRGPVRPSVLMAVLQRVLDESKARVFVDCGNSFAWANAYLRFASPRYRVSLAWGSMGQATAGVVGAALASQEVCVALVGDGALLMQNELSTAVKYEVPAVWVVLNDAQYGMIEQGMRAGGLMPVETQIPRVDFVALAESVGARGVPVHEEYEIERALRTALAARSPFVVDVTIDHNELAPIRSRVSALEQQGVGRTDG